jgi:hypothetical protein
MAFMIMKNASTEGEVKTSTLVALALAAALLGSVAAHAQTEPLTAHHPVHLYYPPHHAVHHRHVAHGPAMAPAPVPAAAAPAPQAGPFGLALPHIAPYPDGKGDEDGLSEDQDDCNKGCIDGNGPD